jgi:2-oxo-4-hydroxy-4-carboxy--5-ureidoimidazoline (OHCU) decarboxylase
MPLDDLNALDPEAAARALLACCGSTEWAREMTAARPFDGPESMAQTSDRIWASLERADWLEAFAAHPRIGDRTAAPAATPRGLPRGVSESARSKAGCPTRQPRWGAGWGRGASAEKVGGADATEWATREQSGVGGAPHEVLERLAAGNRAYESRFGYIFIVCATGKSAGEMLALLEQRLTNDPDEELHIAAEEQRKITRLRLGKLLASPTAPSIEPSPSAEGREAAGGEEPAAQ